MKSLCLLVLSFLLANTTQLYACDLCGCYTPQVEAMPGMEPAGPKSWWNGFYGAVAEQFTHFGTVLIDGREGPNLTGQYENSSITQVVAGYSVNDRLALQLNLPLI